MKNCLPVDAITRKILGVLFTDKINKSVAKINVNWIPLDAFGKEARHFDSRLSGHLGSNLFSSAKEEQSYYDANFNSILL